MATILSNQNNDYYGHSYNVKIIEYYYKQSLDIF